MLSLSFQGSDDWRCGSVVCAQQADGGQTRSVRAMLQWVRRFATCPVKLRQPVLMDVPQAWRSWTDQVLIARAAVHSQAFPHVPYDEILERLKLVRCPFPCSPYLQLTGRCPVLARTRIRAHAHLGCPMPNVPEMVVVLQDPKQTPGFFASLRRLEAVRELACTATIS